MDVTHLLESLNDQQREAVSAPPGNVLVLAGAGSGKTRVLVHRIAWCVQAYGVSPYGILAVTFTNKAANEMRVRIESLLGIPASGMWVGTFHGIAHRILRAHWQEAGLPKTFQILDSEDQFRLVKRVIRELEMDESKWPPKQSQWFINGQKDKGIRSKNLPESSDLTDQAMKRIYQRYEEVCQNAGLVDFAELLLRAFELWRERPDLLDHYRKRFQHILVDEFQDTNDLQYAWLSLLAGDQNCVFVVGDDDQSIYGWRGAKIENIHRFQSDRPNTAVIRLEQNYRSTGNILNAANQLIQNNTGRMGKTLWTSDAEGDPIRFFAAFNEQDESRFVVDVIRSWIDQGGRRSECAVLYRSNAQSRVLEEGFLMAGIPYRIYGGFRFFERAEIKDALAYLRLMVNPNDDTAFERIINTPTRGIGERTVGEVRSAARQSGVPMWNAAITMIGQKTLTARAANALSGFIDLIEGAKPLLEDADISELLEHIYQACGLMAHYQKEKGERGRARIENLKELVNAANEFERDLAEDEPDLDAMSEFLSYTALESGEGQADPGEDCVQMMTLHSAKGLEFPLVFVVGMEEGLFPHELSLQDGEGIEEERRLCYVGMTRARKQLYLTCAEQRRLYGRESFAHPSRFLNEIPKHLMEEVRPRASVSLPMASRFHEDPVEVVNSEGFSIGQSVFHPTFGQGVLLNYEGSGPHARVEVNFGRAGRKWLVLAYANLQPA